MFDVIKNELGIIREKLNHPNIVKYIETFQERNRLYIVMELIEGASLSEHCISLQEKKLRFTEERVWNIFVQLVLALRYLHKEKKIVHRDLTPSNIMLGWSPFTPQLCHILLCANRFLSFKHPCIFLLCAFIMGFSVAHTAGVHYMFGFKFAVR